MARETIPASHRLAARSAVGAALAKNGAKGCGELRIRTVAGESAVVTVRSHSPLKILVPQPRGPSVAACLSSYGGGLVAGDEISVRVELEAGTRLYLSTQSSTKVYRNPGLLPCGQTLTAKLGAEAILVLAPDPVQAFSGALYRQRQEFQLLPDSSLVLVDWFTSGRPERGERWAFARYESRNEIVVAGKSLLFDSLVLDPADGPLDSQYRMGRFNCFALVAIVGRALGQFAVQILNGIAQRPISPRAGSLCGASAIPNGALVRIAGEQVEQVRYEVNRLLDFLPDVLHDDPRSRKW